MTERIAVLGASGYIGRALVGRLAAAGHQVIAVARRAETLPDGPGVTPKAIDAADTVALGKALASVTTVYYLVHSMAGKDFVRRDAHLARSVAAAASSAGVKRIIYLGALGDGAMSAHLASRREVGTLLGSTGVPVVELRAAVILGAGSISFEMMRYLVERLPFMVCPRWVHTRIEPIAERDVLAHLEASLDVEPGVYDLGCGRVSSYLEMMHRFAATRGLRPRLIVNVPLLTLRLSSYWVDLVTPVDRSISHSLIESLAHEVVARDRARTRAHFGITPLGLDEAMCAALDDQRDAVASGLFDAPTALRDGVYTVRLTMRISAAAAEGLRRHLAGVGGSYGWYGSALLWRLRITLGNLVGEQNRLHRPRVVQQGGHVDWWTVESVAPDRLVLRSRGWKPGEAWLGYATFGDQRMIQVAAFRPKGAPGFLYWKLLRPIHAAVFRSMALRQVRRALRAGKSLRSA